MTVGHRRKHYGWSYTDASKTFLSIVGDRRGHREKSGIPDEHEELEDGLLNPQTPLARTNSDALAQEFWG
jgi:hypothetical protein